MKRQPTSRGEMISTLSFLGMGLWCLGQALIAPAGPALALGLCALACFAGAARHRLARLLEPRD